MRNFDGGTLTDESLKICQYFLPSKFALYKLQVMM